MPTKNKTEALDVTLGLVARGNSVLAEIERLGGNSVISKVMTELRDWDR